MSAQSANGVTVKMDEAQPRDLDTTAQGLLGTAMPRPDGPLKVSGRATYSAEYLPRNLATGYLVGATVTKGRVTSMDVDAVRAMPGVLGVFSGEPMVRNPAQGQAGEAPLKTLPEINYFGQPVAVVVAETFEQARHAAQSLRIGYSIEDAEVDPANAGEVERPDSSTSSKGDLEAAMKDAKHALDVTYTTPPHSSAPMEPHASIAEWSDGHLTLYGSYQMLKHNVAELADTLGVPERKVRILSTFVGGGFGSKLGIAPEAVAAAHAARELGRPVRVVMARDQVFEMTMRRTETSQRMRLACDVDGRLVALGHEDRVSNLPGEGFSEPVAQGTHFLYIGDNRLFSQEIARVHRMAAGSVRAPGEAVGMIALECAMDELAEKAGMDPIEFRVLNIPPSRTPLDDLPYSERALERCLREGAERFGWKDRKATGVRREGDWLIGMGVASAVRANASDESIARVTLKPDGTAHVETDMTDIGTGSYAILTQMAGEMLGLPADQVTVSLGDSDLPKSSGSGGSFGAQSSGSSVFLACKGIREQIAKAASVEPDDLTLKDGDAISGNRKVPLSELVRDDIVATGHFKPGETADEFAIAGYGAHFAEVAVNAFTGEARVRRMLGIFSIGRVLNRLTAESQCHGGMIWGIGSALTEELMHDPRDGRVVNHNLAEYHVPVSLDVPQIEAILLEDTRDDQANPIQAKGIGELGISGAAAAIGNAIFNACGVRVRDFPATPDKIIGGLA